MTTSLIPAPVGWRVVYVDFGRAEVTTRPMPAWQYDDEDSDHDLARPTEYDPGSGDITRLRTGYENHEGRWPVRVLAPGEEVPGLAELLESWPGTRAASNWFQSCLVDEGPVLYYPERGSWLVLEDEEWRVGDLTAATAAVVRWIRDARPDWLPEPVAECLMRGYQLSVVLRALTTDSYFTRRATPDLWPTTTTN